MEPVPVRQTLDRRDRLPLELGGEHQAGKAAFAVDQDRAGPAFSASASLLRPREPQLLPDQIDDPPVRGRLDGHFPAVEREGDGHERSPAPIVCLRSSASMIRSAFSGARVISMPQAPDTAPAMAGRGPLMPTSPTPFIP